MMITAVGYTAQEGSRVMTMGRTQGDRLGGTGRAQDITDYMTWGKWLPYWLLASFVIGRGWTL